MKLILGVVDMPYTEFADSGKPKKRKNKTTGKMEVVRGAQTTGGVAEILEKKYKIMSHFFDAHQGEIAAEIVKSLEGSIVNLIVSGHMPSDSSTGFDEAADAIKQVFTQFLDAEEMAFLGVPGVPTQAALEGVNHRFKSKRGVRRPSFIDTGQYQTAMKVWVE